ncbi:MAG: helix-turn-helix domain-containing protein [Candidatus Jettenia sp.]|nr:MAG: helix-turn-helix domain-containing protein [Candidatus Jettenia sp.]
MMNKDITMKKRYVSVKEVSEYTSLPVKTLYDWASQGKVPSIKFGRRVLFDLEDIDQIMASYKRDMQSFKEVANKIIGEIF